jgi:murein DD-endopeptidase MepM/ murein hydrolase activator NlpD
MQNLAIYLLKVHIAIALLYLVYRILLSNNATLIIKRLYLLGSMIFAFVLPFVEFPKLVEINLIQKDLTFDFHYLDYVSEIKFLPISNEIGFFNQFDTFSIIPFIYLIISTLFLIVFLKGLFQILKSIRSNIRINSGKLCFVISEKYVSPFSFFNYIFTKSEKEIEKTPEFLHEMAHVKQLHSIDRLLVEFLVPMLWINPFIYLFKKSIIEVHEHLADKAVIRNGIEPVDYQNYLFSQLKSGQYLKMTSNFNYSLTKKRITMISKHISNRKSMIYTLFSLILVAGIFILYGFNNGKTIEHITEMQLGTINQDISDPVPSILPLKAGGSYQVGSSYGMRRHPYTGKMKMHDGIDIIAETGTEVIAPAYGKVVEAKNDGEYGNCIKIQHGEKYVTCYAHLSGFNVKIGDQVKINDVIGYVGSTGIATAPHLHYEIRKFPDNKPIIYFNPANFISNIKEIPNKKRNK